MNSATSQLGREQPCTDGNEPKHKNHNSSTGKGVATPAGTTANALPTVSEVAFTNSVVQQVAYNVEKGKASVGVAIVTAKGSTEPVVQVQQQTGKLRELKKNVTSQDIATTDQPLAKGEDTTGTSHHKEVEVIEG